jgi:hypothetical protein
VRAAVALLAALALAGCASSSSGPLELVAADPPAGAEARGKTSETTTSQDRGEPIYALAPAEGSELAYTVSMRNTSDKPVKVMGVKPDKDRDGAFVPEGVEGAPVEIPAGATKDVVVQGHVRGCRFGGQKVPLAGPELTLEGEGTQQFDLGLQVELQTARCGG